MAVTVETVETAVTCETDETVETGVTVKKTKVTWRFTNSVLLLIVLSLTALLTRSPHSLQARTSLNK